MKATVRLAVWLTTLAGLAASLPAAAVPPLRIYGNLPGFEMAALSPSGKYTAIIGVVADSRRLLVLDKDEKIVVSAPLGETKVRSINWAGDDKVLLRKSDTIALGLDFTANKTELSSVIVLSVATKQAWQVFRANPLVTGGVRDYYGAVERGGRWYGYFGGITVYKGQPPGSGTLQPELYEVDLDTQKAKRIAFRDSVGEDRDWLLDAQGEVAASLDYISANGAWRIRNGSGKLLASGTAPQRGISLVSLGRSPGTIIYSETDEASGVRRWSELSLEGGTPEPILEDEDINGIITDNRTRLLIGYRREGDTPEAIFYDPVRDKVAKAIRKAFPDQNVELVASNDTHDRWIVRTDGKGDPGSWWVIDTAERTADPLGFSYPLAEADVGAVRTIRYKPADGLEMSGVLTLPPGREPRGLPILIFPHGGPAGRDYPHFDWWAQAFAVRGYAVFQPNFRGSTGFGASFRVAGRGEWGRKMQTDLSDGLAELVKQGIVDPKRACIMGASYGGYAALAGVTLQRGLYRCAVSVAGVSDVNRLYTSDVKRSAGDKTLIRSLKAEIGYGRDLQAISPIRFADRADAPILLIHGKDDIVVWYDQSRIMADALKRADKPVQLVTLNGEDHWLSRSATRLTMLEAAVEFVETHNPPDARR